MIVIQNATILYGRDMKPLQEDIVIDDNKIIEISKNKVNKGKKIDAEGCIVAPAFINSHVHMGDSIAKDVGDGKPVDKIVKPPNGLKHRILNESSPKEIKNSIKGSIEDMLVSGTSTFVDFREGGFEGIELINDASNNSPIRKVILGRHDIFHDIDAKKSEIKKIANSLLQTCDGIGLSGFGEISVEVAILLTKICKKKGKISAIHAAEYSDVQHKSIELSGKSEVQRAVESNFDIIVHVTAPIGDDLNLIARDGNSIACCPRSNGTLGVGIPPLKDISKHKINVLLGTDNIMFNSPNMIREMEYALKVTRAHYREYFSPAQVLKMATVNAADTLNMDTGSIEEDKVPDLIIVKQKSENPILSLINRTEIGDIKGMIIGGNKIY